MTSIDNNNTSTVSGDDTNTSVNFIKKKPIISSNENIKNNNDDSIMYRSKDTTTVHFDQANNHSNYSKPVSLDNNVSSNTNLTMANGDATIHTDNVNSTTLEMPLLSDLGAKQTNNTINTYGDAQTLWLRQQQIVETARKAFESNKTKDVKFRKKQLRQLQLMINENFDAICDALRGDLNKPPSEVSLHEKSLLDNDIRYFLGNLDNFVKPQHKEKTFASFFDSIYVQQEPLGVCLILGAWNYPLLLSLSPFAGAIAAGNCAILKVSEHASITGSLLETLIPRYLDNQCYHVINCDLNGTSHLLKTHKFDHIFYTGGENGGRAVYQEASKKLTPVVLELGGKSPVYMDDNIIDKEAAWRRLFWGKFINCGQTCIAPDYVMCSEKAQDMARKQFVKVMNEFYNGDAINSKDYPQIVNGHHFERLKRLVKDSRLVMGGELHPDKLQIGPAIITDVSLDEPIMKGEIFGPLLPFVTVDSAQQAIDIINRGEKPLALYVFSNSSKTIKKFIRETSSGSMAINDVVIQMNSISLPFGGVGASGFGKYHGSYSLEAFSNSKAIVERGYNPLLEIIGSTRYPPYEDTKIWLLTQLGQVRNFWLPGPKLQAALFFVSGATTVLAYNLLSSLNIF